MRMNPILQIFREGACYWYQCCTFACLKTFGLCNCANSQKLGCDKEFPLFDEGFTGPRLCKPWFASAGRNGELGTTCKACL
ncbi:hypothetical protein RGQ29_014048 [Quercus rubra]|uniref:Uncharacterized protein n=1 Tax=Quercus rubra TaxID=3512 RepID=A0AAN7FRZ8_QUERU|nr:hypothetical protein RGQ29_014048 [Quercus rubra]